MRSLKGGKVLAGFAGSVADAFTLFEKFEEKLDRYPGNLPRAAVELAKDWRSDRVLRRLEALLVVADLEHGFLLSGTGELIEPDDGIVAIGSGGNYALAAARALLPDPDIAAREIVQRSLEIAADICVFTNRTSPCWNLELRRVKMKREGVARTVLTIHPVPITLRNHDRPRHPALRARSHAASLAGGAAAPPDRGGARQVHRRAGRRQEGGRDRGAQSLAPRSRRPRRSATRSRRTTSS